MPKIPKNVKPENRFHNSKGELTPYALACGYVQKRQLEGYEDASVTIWHEGGPTFHVRAHDHKNGHRLFWETSEKLSDVRKIYNRAEAFITEQSTPTEK